MTPLFKSVVPVAATVLLFSCGGNNSEIENENSHSGIPEQTEVQNSQVAPVLKNDKLNAVYQHYVHLTTALTNGDPNEAKVAATAIEAGAENLEGADKVASLASGIGKAPDLKTQRASYSDLTNEMIAMIKKEGLSQGELYQTFCPMAFDGKGGHWLSNSKEIRNPYYGEKMMSCGEVQETIK